MMSNIPDAFDDDGTGRTVLVNDAEAGLVYRGTFVGRPSRAIIEAMVTLEDVEPTNLPVIYSDIDLDALDNLYRNPEQMKQPAELRFSLDRYRFFLSSDRLIEVYELPEADDESTAP